MIKEILGKIKFIQKFRRLQFRLTIAYEKRKGKQIIHFLHIGKTGDTSIKNVFNNKFLTITNKYVFVIHNHGTTLRDIDHDEKVFFIVRDPLTRYTI